MSQEKKLSKKSRNKSLSTRTSLPKDWLSMKSLMKQRMVKKKERRKERAEAEEKERKEKRKKERRKMRKSRKEWTSKSGFKLRAFVL